MSTTDKYDKISGWLWLPAIGLAIQPLQFVLLNIVPFFQDHFPFRIKINYPVLIVDIILLVLIGIVSWFFFNRKRYTPALYILYIFFMVIMWEVVDGLYESQNDPPFIAMIFHTLVIIPYLVLSKRVKTTFKNELQEKIYVERVFIPFSTSLDKFYSKLCKRGYFIFVIVVLFLIAGILLNCALRSLRIDGDLLHTFQYL